MSDGCKLILSLFTGCKKRKAWKKTREKYMAVKRGWLEVFVDGKGGFFNSNESEDSGNDEENYNENNEQQQLS